MPSTPRTRRPHEATLQIRELIREAIYRADDAAEPSPTLAELGDLLQVSRDVLRYNLRVLVAEGAVEIRDTRRREYHRPSGTPSGASGPAPRERALSTDDAILDFIHRRAVAGEFCPTTGELAVALNRSKSTIRRRVRALEQSGRIRFQDILRHAPRREWCIVEEGDG